MKIILVSGLVSILLTGCASTVQYEQTIVPSVFKQSPDLAPTNGNAKIYALRKSRLAGAAVTVSILDTGSSVGKIASGGVLSWERPPGAVVLEGIAKYNVNLSFSVSAGDVVFIEVSSDFGLFGPQPTFRLLSRDEGRAMLRELQGS